MQNIGEKSVQTQQVRIEDATGRHVRTKQQLQNEPEMSLTSAEVFESKHATMMDNPVPNFPADGKGSSDGTFTLLLFASAQTYADDTESLILPAPTTLGALFQELERRYPGIGQKVLRSCGVSVNLEYVDFEWEDVMADKKEESGRDTQSTHVIIRKGDEVGIIPPVSSG